jgi:hypothetical protein
MLIYLDFFSLLNNRKSVNGKCWARHQWIAIFYYDCQNYVVIISFGTIYIILLEWHYRRSQILVFQLSLKCPRSMGFGYPAILAIWATNMRVPIEPTYPNSWAGRPRPGGSYKSSLTFVV